MTNHESCCHATSGDTTLRSSALATLHCLTGCTIGEFLGLAIGVTLGWSMWPTIALAVGLAFLVGLALTIFPLMRRESLTFSQAWRVVWLGEVISISVMELAENYAGYHVGGMAATSLADPIFWYGMLAAVVAGFLAAWPVNFWLLRRELKKCH